MNVELEAERSLERIWMALDKPKGWKKLQPEQFEDRLRAHFSELFSLLYELYGHQYDFYFHLQGLVQSLLNGYSQRTPSLKQRDKERSENSEWYRDESVVGMACYVDLFAGDLKSIIDKIPYLKELGISYLHLMPLYDAPDGDSDGGYAVSDYRKVNPKLGTLDDLKVLADTLSKSGISLVLDFVFNHTSDEHRWAIAAQQGDLEHQNFYYMFDDKEVPNQYEKSLREIFPQVRRGNFTWNDSSQKWVWTTFNNFQWDLNYSNPAVFNAITEEMLFLANIGCSALRLDALAFIWKEMGTSCENRPKAHSLIRAFNACLKIVSPSVVFKSEAIVHPDEVNKYIDEKECQLSYNPLLMALIWDSLATRKTNLLTKSMHKSFSISDKCAWVNYARCHDDIGWTFDDDVASNLAIYGNDHRSFLNQFYTNRFEGTFATGVAFGENPSTGDCRVCGSLASLCGLEKAMQLNDQKQINDAIKRVLLVHSIIFSIGGVPLLYSGDELGLLNQYDYQQDVAKQHDARWVHRLPILDADIERAHDKSTPNHQIFSGLQRMIGLRKQHAVFGRASTQIIDTHNQHLFAYLRQAENGQTLLAICNFSEYRQVTNTQLLEHFGYQHCKDLVSGNLISTENENFEIEAYQFLWLTRV